MRYEPLRLPFNIREFNEDMVVGLDRNFSAIEQALSRIQVYENKYGIPVNEDVKHGISIREYLTEYGDRKVFHQDNPPPIGMGPAEAREFDLWWRYVEGVPVWKQLKKVGGQLEWVVIADRTTHPAEYDMITTVGLDAGVITTGYLHADRIEAGSITGSKISSSTTITAGEGNEVGVLDGTGNYRIYAGHAQASAAPFSVYKDGAIYSSSGLIGGWSIDGESGLKLGSGSDTRGIATGDYTFYAGNASPSHAPFRVTKEGTFVAQAGNLQGLTLGDPSDSGLYISNDKLGYYDGGTWRTYMNNQGHFYLGGSEGSLTWDGSSLQIEGSGTFTGTIVANEGYIGSTSGWVIDNEAIYSNDIELRVGIGTNGYIRNMDNKWLFYNDGSGQLAGGTLSWTSGGTLTLTGGFLGGENKVIIDSSGLDVGSLGSIRGGASSTTSGNGFWMGYAAGTYQFRVGAASSSGERIFWDGSNLNIRGNIIMEDGSISWSNVDPPTAAEVGAHPVTTKIHTEEEIEGISTEITENTVTTAFVNALNVTAASIIAGDEDDWVQIVGHGLSSYLNKTKRIELAYSYLNFFDSNGVVSFQIWGNPGQGILASPETVAIWSGYAEDDYTLLQMEPGIVILDMYAEGAGVLAIGGSVDIEGSLSKGSGTFRIKHPLDPDNKDLIHGFVEAPRYDLIYRGKIRLVDGEAEVDIDDASNMTPGTFEALTQNAVVMGLCNLNGFSRVKPTAINKGRFNIICEDKVNDLVSWMVIAERADEFILNNKEASTDRHGRLIPEEGVGMGSHRYRRDQLRASVEDDRFNTLKERRKH